MLETIQLTFALGELPSVAALTSESISAWLQEVSSSPQALWSIAILGLSAFIQATVGFAAALFGLPLLIWAGNDLMTSQVMMITAMLPQNILGVVKFRKSIELPEVVYAAILRTAALPLGIFYLGYVLTWNPGNVKQLIGVVLLLATIIQLWVGIEWKHAKRFPSMLLVFGGSGFLQGLSGMSGPPMVLWVHGQRYGTQKARAFLFAVYIANVPPQLALLWYRYGSEVVSAFAAATLSLPLVLLAASAGLRLGTRLGDERLRKSALGVLAVLAVVSIMQPILFPQTASKPVSAPSVPAETSD